MATPRNDNYSVASGGTIYAGISAAPAWMTSIPVGGSLQLTNSTLSTSITNVESYTGMVIDANLNVWIAAGGGHSNGTNNGVGKYALGVDSPTGWVAARMPSSPATPSNQAYFSDGRPNARHVYESIKFDEDTGRVLLIGLYAAGDSINSFNTIDGFNTVTGDWDTAGTYPYSNSASTLGSDDNNHGSVRDPVTGDIYWLRGTTVYKWKPGQPTKTDLGTTVGLLRYPNCWDSVRGAIYSMMWADGQGTGSGLTCVQTLTPGGTPTKRTITLSGSGLAALQAGNPTYAAMDHDATRDTFLFVHGSTTGYAGPPAFYEITPNSGTSWTVTARTFTGTIGPVGGTGAVGKLKFIKRGDVSGFIIYTNALYFLRTA